jgi:competence protein ComEA
MEAGRADDDPAFDNSAFTGGGWVDRLHHGLDIATAVNWRAWLVAAAAVVGGGLLIFSVGVRAGSPDPIDLPRVDAATVARLPPPSTVDQGMHVHVAGQVVQPGLYRVASGSRVAELIEAAGGPTAIGDIDRLNLAALLSDGQRIEVPAVGAPFAAPVGSSHESAAINVNRATAAELEGLPGIGPALAAAIVEHRSRAGDFATVDDLVDVPGIGPATVERLRSRASV